MRLFVGDIPHVENVEEEVKDSVAEELVFLGRCWCVKVGNLHSCCDNYINMFFLHEAI